MWCPSRTPPPNTCSAACCLADDRDILHPVACPVAWQVLVHGGYVHLDKFAVLRVDVYFCKRLLNAALVMKMIEQRYHCSKCCTTPCVHDLIEVVVEIVKCTSCHVIGRVKEQGASLLARCRPPHPKIASNELVHGASNRLELTVRVIGCNSHHE